MSSVSVIIRFVQQYSLYTTYIIHGLGLLGNTLGILVFVNLKIFRNNRFTLYLILETICNFTNELLTVIGSLASVVYGDSELAYSIAWCRARYIIFQTTALITLSMICSAAIDQFCSTHYRLDLRQTCTHRFARCFIIASICFWILHSAVFSLFLGIHPAAGCVILNPIWVQYSTYFFYPVLAGLLPIVVASSFSLLAYRNVRRIVRRQIPVERRRFDQQITAMILARVILFIACILPYTCYRIYAINVKIDPADQQRSAIERLVQVVMVSFYNLNYAVSFYMFLILTSRYRRQARQVLVKKCWRRLKRCCLRTETQIYPENTAVSEENIDPQ